MRRPLFARALGLAGLSGVLLASADAATGPPDTVVVPAGGSYVARPGG